MSGWWMGLHLGRLVCLQSPVSGPQFPAFRICALAPSRQSVNGTGLGGVDGASDASGALW